MRERLQALTGKFLDFVLKNSIGVIVGILVLVTVLGLGISRLSVDSDMLHWFAKDSKIAGLQYYINDTFNVNNPTIVMLETDGVFKRENVALIRELCKRIKNVQDVNEVISITEIEDVRSTEEGVIIDKLFPGKIPQEQKKINAVRDYVMGLEKYNGTLVSADGKSATIIVKGLPNSKSDRIAKDVKTVVTDYLKSNRPDVKPFFAGTPALMNSVTDIVIGDIGFLVPLVALVILLVLFVSFRHPYGTLLPLVIVSLATVASMGIMGYIGMPLTPLGIAIPVVMMAIGNAYGIYIISEYYENCLVLGDKDRAVHDASKRLLVPITMSGLTVFVGFLSLVTASGLKAIIDFSLINAIGVVFSFALTLTFMPAVLKRLPMAKRKYRSEESGKESGILRRIAVWIDKNKPLVLAALLTIVGLNIFFATKIKTDSDYLKYFKEGSEPRVVTAKVAEVFQGTGELTLYFKGDATDPMDLKTLTAIEEKARLLAGSRSRASSIVETVATLNANMTQVKRLPDTQTEINNLWFFIEGNDQISKMVSRDKTEFTSGYLLSFLSTSDKRNAMLRNIDGLMREYGTVRMVSNRTDNAPALDLASVMLYNRFVRKDIQTALTDVRQALDRIVEKTPKAEYDQILKNEKKQKAWLDGTAGSIRSGLLKGKTEISREDLVYALSPLVWQEVPVPDPNGAKVFEKSGISGIIKLFTDMDKIVVENQITSIITAVIIVMILIALMFRSVLTGALSILTVVFTVIVNFGFMGMTGIPLNFVTVTVASISIGAGIDYTIQYMARYFHEINVSKLPPRDAFIRTIATIGRAILSNALAVGLGFAVLYLSNILPLRDFGLQMFVTMITSSLATVTLMPIVLLYLAKFLHPKVAE